MRSKIFLLFAALTLLIGIVPVRAQDDGLAIDYEVTAGARSVPFLWAAHPQFRAPASTRVELPSAVRTVIDVMDPTLPERPWSSELGSIDTIAPAGYRKVYAHPDLPVEGARLVHPDGALLDIRWTHECPYVGLWFDKFDFRSEGIIAIEPTTAYFDSLDTAIALGRAPKIAPGETLAWTLFLRVVA